MSMKTEKEIRDRIELHNQKLTTLDGYISQESRKIFPNKRLIKQLEQQMAEEHAAKMLLLWMLT